MKVFAGLIYKAKRGQIYDPVKREYNCYSPAWSGNFGIVDCWVCDETGRIHPGFSNYPVPVIPSEVLGEPVNSRLEGQGI
jgi:hypothetical protein